jgi:hypothetical protein
VTDAENERRKALKDILKVKSEVRFFKAINIADVVLVNKETLVSKDN